MGAAHQVEMLEAGRSCHIFVTRGQTCVSFELSCNTVTLQTFLQISVEGLSGKELLCNDLERFSYLCKSIYSAVYFNTGVSYSYHVFARELSTPPSHAVVTSVAVVHRPALRYRQDKCRKRAFQIVWHFQTLWCTAIQPGSWWYTTDGTELWLVSQTLFTHLSVSGTDWKHTLTQEIAEYQKGSRDGERAAASGLHI